MGATSVYKLLFWHSRWKYEVFVIVKCCLLRYDSLSVLFWHLLGVFKPLISGLTPLPMQGYSELQESVCTHLLSRTVSAARHFSRGHSVPRADLVAMATCSFFCVCAVTSWSPPTTVLESPQQCWRGKPERERAAEWTCKWWNVLLCLMAGALMHKGESFWLGWVCNHLATTLVTA